MSVVEQHVASIRIGGLRPRTIECRSRILRTFQRQLEPTSLLEATRADIETYLGADLALRSRVTYLTHLRCFYRWALDLDLIEHDPTAKIKLPRVPLGVPRPLSQGDLAYAVEHATPTMRAWLLLMALAGLRCIEVSHLRPADIMDAEGIPLLYLRECKGGGTATVPAHTEVLAALNALPIRNGAWWDITAKTISKYVSSYLRSLGIDGTAHQLRHTAGTAWYRESGHDLLTTARLMRHAHASTTQIYSQLDPTRPAEVVRLVKLPSLQAV